MIKNEEIINKFKKLLAEQTKMSSLIENKNIFYKQNIQPLYENIKSLSQEEKREFGKQVNQLKTTLEGLFQQKKNELEEEINKKENVVDYNLNVDTFDLSKGAPNLISIVTNDIISYFKRLNFEIVEGSEIVSVDENMNWLNIDETHPVRDPKDTFYINKNLLLRTHCTAITAKTIHNQNKEIKVLSYGNVYRNDDDDMTHSHQFNQVDIVWIKKGLTINHLKSIIDELLKHIFSKDVKTRYRLSFFPFTEPSFEVDISCCNCHGKGCEVCKHSGWIEILGAGMLHKNVFDAARITSFKTGIAAGLGIERIAMLKYGLKNVRDLYNNDFRLIEQIKKGGN